MNKYLVIVALASVGCASEEKENPIRHYGYDVEVIDVQTLEPIPCGTCHSDAMEQRNN
jgi:pyruvate/2-oxoglutarate/acetoin dehydrogenase E1 component